MDRREHLKLLLSGALGAGLLASAACTPEETAELETLAEGAKDGGGGGYGRTPEEIAHDERMRAETFFTGHEMATLAVLSDIIIPADDVSGSATDAGVPDFLEFMAKDAPQFQLPLRGGLAWIDAESRRRFGGTFTDVTDAQRLEIVEDIAWADRDVPGMAAGKRFFSRLRGLVCTGFYTTRIGFDDLGYVGNQPNAWDGVPDEVLRAHGLSYDNRWKDRYLTVADRDRVVDWDADGNPV